MTIFQKKIAVSILLGFALIGASIATNRYTKVVGPADITAEPVNVTVIERKFIPTTDLDKNGIADWQDGFPTKATSTPTSSKPHVAPDTLTSEFGLRVYKELEVADSFGVLNEAKDQMIKNGIISLRRKAADEPITQSELLTFEPTTATALRDYGNLVANIILSNQTQSEHELEIFSDYLNTENPNRLAELEPIQKNYENIVSQLTTVAVPNNYVPNHLKLVNAFQALQNDVGGMLLILEDPLYTYLRYTRFNNDVEGVGTALTGLYGALYLQDGIRYEVGESVRELIQYTD